MTGPAQGCTVVLVERRGKDDMERCEKCGERFAYPVKLHMSGCDGRSRQERVKNALSKHDRAESWVDECMRKQRGKG